MISVDPAVFIMLAAMVLLFPVPWVFAWIGAVLVHELGHYLMVRLCGYRVHEICIGINGAKMQTEALSPVAQVFSSLAGPVAGLCLFPLRRICPHLTLCALLHSAYNLMPVQGLDGEVALQSILEMLFGDTISLRICTVVEWVFLGFCVFFAVYMAQSGLGWLPLLAVIILVLRNKKIKFSCKQGLLAVQ